MAYTGKATYSAGATLPEIAEDVSDIIGIVSPFETPLLDHLGDPQRAATATVHEWLEDALLPNTDAIADETISNGRRTRRSSVSNPERFRVGDQIQVEGSREVMLVTAVNASALTVVRGLRRHDGGDGGQRQRPPHPGQRGAGRRRRGRRAQFTNRVRQGELHADLHRRRRGVGSQLAVRQVGVADELDYQKQERLRELLRDLENCVINGVARRPTRRDRATVRRTMKGIIPFLATNVFVNGTGGFPAGEGTSTNLLTEEQLNTALRKIWDVSAGKVDTIVVSGFQKRRINSFITSSRRYGGGGRAGERPGERLRVGLRRVPGGAEPVGAGGHGAAAGQFAGGRAAAGGAKLPLQEAGLDRRQRSGSGDRRIHAGVAQRERARADPQSGDGVGQGLGFRGQGSGSGGSGVPGGASGGDPLA